MPQKNANLQKNHQKFYKFFQDFIICKLQPVATEVAIIVRIQMLVKITLEKIAAVLRDLSCQVELDGGIIERARRPIEKMLEMSR